MDKVKVFLAVMKKQHFWVMSGAALLVGLIGWFLATSKLRAEYTANRGKIETKFKGMEQLRSQERENQKWIDGVKAETGQLKIKVKEAWEDVYAEQRDKVLRWPKVLGPEFLQIVPDLPPNEDIPVDQRERYWNYVQEEFPQLLKIVDARSYLDKADDSLQPQRAGAPRVPPRGGVPRAGGQRKPVDADVVDDHDYKVIWDRASQESIDTRLNWTSTPSNQEVRQTQEDLWVYQALLTIIAHLNERADGHHNAKVKEIRSLLIGKEAALEFQIGMAEGRIERPESLTAQPGTPGAPPIAPPIAPPQNPAQAGRGGSGGPGLKEKNSDEGRYVDEKGAPVTAEAATPEFKRMPVVMRLLMDQKEISRLLVECANSPLPVEVRQFRIPNFRNASPFGASKGTARPRPVVGGGSGGPVEEERDKNPYDVVVELYGIIYIFNPPDQAKLADAKATEAAATAETPAEEATEQPSAESDDNTAAAKSADEAPAADAPAADGEAGEGEAADEAEGAAKPAADADQPATDEPAEAMPDEDK